MTLAAVTVAFMAGMSLGIGQYDDACSYTGFTAIRGGSGRYPSPPSGGLGEGGVDQRPVAVDLVSRVEFGEQHRTCNMAGSRPPASCQSFEILPAGLAATAAQFRREIRRGDAGA